MAEPPPDAAPLFRDLIADLSVAESRALAAMLDMNELPTIAADWRVWAHPGQYPPPGDWRTWVVMAGRGFGKTRAGSEWIAARIREALQAGRSRADPLRIALVAASFDEARAVMIEGASGLLAVAPELIASWTPTRRLLRFTGGAEARLFSGGHPEALRGPEHHLAWCDELAKWDYPGQTWDMLQLGLRLGTHPRALVTTTPRPGETLRRIMAAPGCTVTGGPTSANPHLPDAFIDAVNTLYAGTRLGRQELDGELLSDTPGALWTVELLEKCRIPPLGPPLSKTGEGDRAEGVVEGAPRESTTFTRCLIGVDPPSGDGTCGIIACALDTTTNPDRPTAYVLADHSVTARSPEGWARAVAHAAQVHGATLIVAEQNQGGKMVEAVLRAAIPPRAERGEGDHSPLPANGGGAAGFRVRRVTASAGKSARAEPVATLFEAGRVKLAGHFSELEAELCGMIAGGGYDGPGTSPDRADAMVWALTELLVGKGRAEPRVRAV